MRPVPSGRTGPSDRFGRPGAMLIVRFGKRKWNWPRAISPCGSKAPRASGPDRPDLGREPAALVEAVRLGGDVDDLDEPGVRDPAVVALEVVLAAHLPVRRHARGGAGVEDERVDVDAGRRDELRQLAERLLEGGRVRVGVDEHERAPGPDRERDEPERLEVETALHVRAGCGAQAPVELVRPRVVRALDRRAPALALDEQRAAVPADVEEGAEEAVLARASDQNGHVAAARREERARIRMRDRRGRRTASSG